MRPRPGGLGAWGEPLLSLLLSAELSRDPWGARRGPALTGLSSLPAGGRQKGPTPGSSLMRSESELDSDDAIFTWPDRDKGPRPQGQNGSVPNGQAPLKARGPRQEIL